MKYYYRFIVDDEFNIVYVCDITENVSRATHDPEANYEYVKRTHDGQTTGGISGEINIYLSAEEYYDFYDSEAKWRVE